MARFTHLLICICGLSMHLSTVSSLGERQSDTPTLYEYFLPLNNGNATGLVAEQDGFKLNGKKLRIISGAIHYFRVHPNLWRDRLRKLRASGANTVETYVAWNLHEPIPNEFDFGNGTNDMSMFLDIRSFIKIAQEEDLLLLLRPGPYICSEFEFGGMPSWLLRDPGMKVRTAYPPYLVRVQIYLDNLLPQVVDLQFTRGGPIIALQIENEYASFDQIDLKYLELIEKAYKDNGINSLLFTSDGSWNQDKGSLPGVLKTANFQDNPDGNIGDLLAFQPDKPVMVMEYWAGWFDHWFENHSTTAVSEFTQVVEVILGKYNGSINFYMFHGGTNFGFLAGANSDDNEPFYAPDVTSYDYDGPLSEAGDYTEKYVQIMLLTEKYQEPTLRRPNMVVQSRKVKYSSIQPEEYLNFEDILSQVPSTAKFFMDKPISMENLQMNQESGQSQGYILYRVSTPITSTTSFKAGPVKDFGILLVDGVIQPYPRNSNGTVMYWLNSVQQYEILPSVTNRTIDLLIENMGRVNFGKAEDFVQHKGLLSGVNDTFQLGGNDIQGVEIIALEFKSSWVKGLQNWKTYSESTNNYTAPVIFRTTLSILDEPADTFIDMSGWTKGVVFVNGFNLGRYFNVGPQKTLYLPAPFLQRGNNTIVIFEQLQAGTLVEFADKPNLGIPYVKHNKS